LTPTPTTRLAPDAGWTQPQGKTVTITFRAVVANTQGLAQVSNQGTVSGSNFANILTDDPDTGAANDATVTVLDRTNVAVASSADPSVFGQNITFTATLTGTPARLAGNPGGTVQFKDNGVDIGTAIPVVAGAVNTATAQFSTSELSVGDHTITAEYSGGNGFNPNVGTLTGNPQTVGKASTTTGLTSSSDPSVAGQAVTFTATVNPVAPGSGTRTGTVTFKDNGTAITGCSAVAVSTNQAQCATSALTIGNHSITAEYSGDVNFNLSTGTLTGDPQVVNMATTVVVDDSFAGSTDGQDLGSGRIFNRNAFASISGGLSNVAAGGTVNVADGSYTESVTLNQSATIAGTGDITLNGSLTITNGTWTSTSGIMAITGNFTRSGGTFTPNGGTVAFTGSAAQTIGGTIATTFNGLTINNAANVNLNNNATVNGALTLTNGILATGSNTLTLSTTGTTTRDNGCAITTCFVTSSTGGVKKQFNAATTNFVFNVGTSGGTDNGHSPVTLANVTPTGTGELTIRAVDAASPAAISTDKITRYWSLSGSNLTIGNLSFTYLDGDIVGAETNYRVFKEELNQCTSDCVDDATNTGSVTNVSSFSDWTIAAIAPTSATATISGRISSPSGRGLSRVRVMISGGTLTAPRFAQTNAFGYYRLAGVPTGATYILSVESKQHRFAQSSRVINILEDISDVDFTGGN
jgi:hypothetical protein